MCTSRLQLFSSPPIVSGAASGDVWSDVFETAHNIPNGAHASLQIVTNDCYAKCGSLDDNADHGAQVSVSKAVPVKLGSRLDGGITMGSSVALSVYDKESCDLSAPTDPGNGKLGNFELTTSSHEFTVQDAKNRESLLQYILS